MLYCRSAERFGVWCCRSIRRWTAALCYCCCLCPEGWYVCTVQYHLTLILSFMFDEPSSYLDVKQRLKAARVIRSLLSPHMYWCFCTCCWVVGSYVIVVEHDLSVLDYLSDFICCLYGQPGAYGVVTLPFGVREGIHNYRGVFSSLYRYQHFLGWFRTHRELAIPRLVSQFQDHRPVGNWWGNPKTQELSVPRHDKTTRYLQNRPSWCYPRQIHPDHQGWKLHRFWNCGPPGSKRNWKDYFHSNPCWVDSTRQPSRIARVACQLQATEDQRQIWGE